LNIGSNNIYVVKDQYMKYIKQYKYKFQVNTNGNQLFTSILE